MAACGTQQVMPAVTHGQVTESCYQMDMGKDGEIPRDRRIWYKTGMSSTTLDLFGGTTKATYQVLSILPPDNVCSVKAGGDGEAVTRFCYISENLVEHVLLGGCRSDAY